MIFICDSEGTVRQAAPSPLYQGSHNFNEIVLLAPFTKASCVQAAFRLPNGIRTTRALMGAPEDAYSMTKIIGAEGNLFY